jgi:trimeric autotransporter adhesin
MKARCPALAVVTVVLTSWFACGCSKSGSHSSTSTASVGSSSTGGPTGSVSSQTFTTVVGLPGTTLPLVGDGDLAINALLETPRAIAPGPGGTFIVADVTGSRFRSFTVGGSMTTIAGNGEEPVEGIEGQNAGPAELAGIPNPSHVAMDANGVIFLAQFQAAIGTILVVNPVTGIMTPFAGGGSSTGDGAANSVRLGVIDGLLALPGNVIIFSERAANRVRRLRYTFDPVSGQTGPGQVETICGALTAGTSADGTPARQALLNFPRGLAYAQPLGKLFISDFFNHKVVAIDLATPGGTPGAFTTVAGTGVAGNDGEGGPATSALLDGPWGLAFDPASSNIYVADFSQNVLKRFKLGGTITTVAGNGRGGEGGFGNSQTTGAGIALGASIGGPEGICIASDGSVLVCLEGAHQIVRYDPRTLMLDSVAGQSSVTFPPPGFIPANFADVHNMRLAFAKGRLIVCDSYAHVLRDVDPVTGFINTIAGTGNSDVRGSGQSALSRRRSRRSR